MIVFEGEKYACLPCIRGHRSSTCNHCDRPLLQVRKRGRPLASETKRIAIIPEATPAKTTTSSTTSSGTSSAGSSKDCGCDSDKSNHFEVIKIEGQHSKKLVDTKDGVVRVVSDQEQNQTNNINGNSIRSRSQSNSASPRPIDPLKRNSFVEENPRCCCAPGPCYCENCTSCKERSKINQMKKVRLKVKRQQKKKPIEIEEVFVSVGNGLYKKERRNKLTGEVIPDEPLEDQLRDKVKIKSEEFVREELAPAPAPPKAPLIIAPMCFEGLDLNSIDFNGIIEQYNSNDSLITSPSEDYYPAIANGLDEAIATQTPTGYENITNQSSCCGGKQEASNDTPSSSCCSLKNQSNNLSNSSLEQFNQMSVLPEAPLTEISTNQTGSSFLDFDFISKLTEKEFLSVTYAPNCVLPGQCQCGDDCKCEGCSTHGNN
ncbi:similar to Saccharomyces cerevisiae YMR021C MAC1 Copper-sensing transcription factor involved in regulation of genes required for high affinity copper transport [Geotrichum candidum]|uniref:Similar to Saccharomyces cerevisiae YMR021C MAC1 Copper-sensing transcription factor involved in regulation of genes required for high affinity copper transport n=1 Tax=Geotrichum candidum TaxID=1173061 RepID=A0A0J9XAI3_GEOCN|nr:similar to Saccharomyces cerevisiae YMR021C MAC1 Copper-sensing transcription factor involved in regulation of genes required for high affinity copper transport [Geotrichum candidum]